MVDSLDTLLRGRFHGAANIYGIRYQLKYAAHALFGLYESGGPTQVRFEGIEDVDLVGMKLGSTLVQAKASRNGWAWKRTLADPIKSFMSCLRLDPSARFELVTSFPLNNDLGRLQQRNGLKPRDREKVEYKFQTLCSELGFDGHEAAQLLLRLELRHLTESYLDKTFQLSILKHWESVSPLSYVAPLIARCLEWASDRESISRSDLELLRDDIAERMAIERSHYARANHLVSKVDWNSDLAPSDFQDGRDTRPGHIADNLPVERPLWEERVMRGLEMHGACIIRGPSGAGKSTIAFRAALKRAQQHACLLVHQVQSETDVGEIRDYLRARINLGIYPILIVDDAARRRGFWPDLVRACASLGLNILITIRTEDWNTSASAGLRVAEVEPWLSREEASQLYGSLIKTIGSTAQPPKLEWALEQLGKPPLLMEFVHLIVRGTTLRDRLADQLKRTLDKENDRVRRAILRRVSLCHLAGTPLDIRKTLASLSPQGDVQALLSGLEGEFIRHDAQTMTGLHHVRSGHLCAILHDPFPTLTDTALASVGSVREGDVALLIRGLAKFTTVDIYSVVEAAKRLAHSTGSLVSVLSAAFEAGELRHLESISPTLNAIHVEHGPNVLGLAASTLLPAGKIDLSFMEEVAKGFGPVLDSVERLRGAPRGRDLCHRLLSSGVLPSLSTSAPSAFAESARLLDWYGFCGVRPAGWGELVESLIHSADWTSAEPSDVATLLFVVHRIDPDSYRKIIESWLPALAHWLAWKLDCLSVTRVDAEVTVEFLCDGGDKSPNDQAMDRIQVLREVFPDAELYVSRPTYLLPFNLRPSVDGAVKNIPRANLYSRTDVARNALWSATVGARWACDSFYSLQEQWAAGRRLILRTINDIGDLLESRVRRATCTKDWSYISTLRGQCVTLPSLADFVKARGFHEDFGRNVSKADGWPTNVLNFVSQIVELFSAEVHNTARLLTLTTYMNESISILKEVFEVVFAHSPDYFEAAALSLQESIAVERIRFCLEVMHSGHVLAPEEALAHGVEAVRRIADREALDALHDAVRDENLESRVAVGGQIIRKEYMREACLMVEVDRPSEPHQAIILAAKLLLAAHDHVDFFNVIPVWNRKILLLDRAYFFGTYRAEEILRSPDDVAWETLAGRDLPAYVRDAFVDFPRERAVGQELNVLVLCFGYLQRLETAYAQLDTLAQEDVIEGSEFRVAGIARQREKLRELGTWTRETLATYVLKLSRVADRCGPAVAILGMRMEKLWQSMKDGQRGSINLMALEDVADLVQQAADDLRARGVLLDEGTA